MAFFQPGDATFVMLSDLKESCGGVAQCSDLAGVFLAFAQEKFSRLGQRFVTLGQSVQTFIDGHLSPPPV